MFAQIYQKLLLFSFVASLIASGSLHAASAPRIFQIHGQDDFSLYDDLTAVEEVIVTDDDYEGIMIPAGIFAGCVNLEKVTIGDCCSIDEHAFEGTQIRELKIGELVDIGSRAFAECINLERVDIDCDCTIGEKVFEGCVGMRRISLDNDVFCSPDAFDGCMNLVFILKEGDSISNSGNFPNPNDFGGANPKFYCINGSVTSYLGSHPVQPLTLLSLECSAEIQQLNGKITTLEKIIESGKPGQVLSKNTDGRLSWDSPTSSSVFRDKKIELEKGWNLIAFGSEVVIPESEKALLDTLEFYTYDKEKKAFVAPESLDHFGAYWINAPEKCTIHLGEAIEP